ncbi:MAG: beta-ketoacyl synthase N-terminal-like domain-containing protein, partial [Cyanobacteria bacterium J06649_4]
MLETEFAAPTTPTEERLCQIWCEVLRLEQVSIHDNFFELGGTSLRLMQVLGKLQNQIDPTLSAVALFQYPTITSLAEYLRSADSVGSDVKQHDDVQSLIEKRIRDRTNSPSAIENTTDIAVIGMAGRFPGAPNLDAFWQNLTNSVESITFFTDEEMLASGISPDLIQDPNYVNASPTLADIDCFDADFFGYSPKEAKLMDPQQRLLLECAWESLENAGYNPFVYEGSIGLYAGATMNTYLLNHVYPNRHTLDGRDRLDVFTLSSFGGFQTSIANDKDYLTTRVSYKLNLRGPSVNVQTACSTSLVSIHLATQSLLQGECDMALAGGVSVETPQKAGYLYQEGMILSADGHCRAFDASSKGTLFGSGVGLVVLKQLDKAIEDRDFVYAVIKGSAVGNDGGQKVGYLAPLSEGQTRVAAEALAIARTPAHTIGYVEAHGTGTQLGDPIEIAALTQAFHLSESINKSDSELAPQSCPIGSVKTNVGHLNIASGIVGFIKTALAVHHGQIPASLHFTQANPQIDFENSPFYVNTQLRDWSKKETPRRATVNSLGIGGTNVHMVLEESPQFPAQEASSDDKREQETEIFVLSAKSEAGLKALVAKYVDFLSEKPKLSLSDICFTLAVGRSHFARRLALTISSVEDLLSQLHSWQLQEFSPTPTPTSANPSSIAFLFTGQGSQTVGMGRELYKKPVFKETLDRCAEILTTHGVSLLDLLYPSPSDPSGTTEQLGDEPLHQTANAQPVLFAVEYALAQLWQSWGISPAAVLGHSLGEYVAACVAGIFSLEDALKLVSARGRLMQTMPEGGAMVSVMASEETCAELLEEYGDSITLAAVNGPQAVVLSGEERAIALITQQLVQQQIQCKPLKVSHAFHSAQTEPMLEAFRRVAESVTYQQPKLSVVSNVTGAVAQPEKISTPEYWVNHVRQPVRFAQGIQSLVQQGTSTFVECGPRPVLLSLGQANLPDPALTWLASLHPKRETQPSMLTSLAMLHELGHEIAWHRFYQNSNCRRVPLPTYAFERQRHWLERPQQETDRFIPSTRYPLSTSEKEAVHPLLGESISTPLQQKLFQQTLTDAQPILLQGHQVYSKTLLPGTGYLEIALAAGITALKTDSLQLSTVDIVKPLELSETLTELQTILSPDKAGYRFEIYSRQYSAEQTAAPDWQQHCTGTVSTHDDASPASVDITALQQTFRLSKSSAEHYADCERLGLSYGGSFKSLSRLWYSDGGALGEIQLSSQAASDVSQYHLHPGILDACFQCVLAALSEDAIADAYVPIGLESLTFYRTFSAEESVWSEVKLRPQTQNKDVAVADVRILDSHGESIAHVSGLAAKRMPQHRQSRRECWQSWLYEVVWQPAEINDVTELERAGAWLIVGDESEWVSAIADRLTQQGQTCVQAVLSNENDPTENITSLNSETPEDFVQLVSSPPLEHWQGVIYCSRKDRGKKDHSKKGKAERDYDEEITTRSCQGALHLTQALINATAAVPNLWFVTCGTQSVKNEASSNIHQSP